MGKCIIVGKLTLKNKPIFKVFCNMQRYFGRFSWRWYTRTISCNNQVSHGRKHICVQSAFQQIRCTSFTRVEWLAET